MIRRRLQRRGVRGPIESVLAIVLLVVFGTAVAHSHAYFTAAKRTAKAKVRPYAIASSATGRRGIYEVSGAAPGDRGLRTEILTNVGKNPARIVGTRTGVRRSGLDQYLTVSIYDATTRQCLYPKPRPAKAPKRKRGRRPVRPRPSGPCRALASWPRAPRAIRLEPKPTSRYLMKGLAAQRWKRKERHVVQIRWALSPDTPGTAQGLRSAYVLRWRASR